MNSIANDQVIEIHYTLKLDNGDVIDSTDGFKPLAYIHGKNNIVPGLEKELSGKKVGDSFKVSVTPNEAYGEKNPNLVQVVTKDQFRNADEIQVGMQFQARSAHGQPMLVEIVNIDGDKVTLDANHPLAGKTLHFDVKVESIRQATEEELAHGHLHMGAGCCGGGEGGCGSSCGDEEEKSSGGCGCGEGGCC